VLWRYWFTKRIYIPNIVFRPITKVVAIAVEMTPIVNHTKTNVALSIILFSGFIITVFKVNNSNF